MSERPVSFYFGSGTRRHLARGISGEYVTFLCGMGGRIEDKITVSRAPANCLLCLRVAAGSEKGETT